MNVYEQQVWPRRRWKIMCFSFSRRMSAGLSVHMVQRPARRMRTNEEPSSRECGKGRPYNACSLFVCQAHLCNPRSWVRTPCFTSCTSLLMFLRPYSDMSISASRCILVGTHQALESTPLTLLASSTHVAQAVQHPTDRVHIKGALAASDLHSKGLEYLGHAFSFQFTL
jgi:hypothetical protein